jgi:hypothetical protein
MSKIVLVDENSISRDGNIYAPGAIELPHMTYWSLTNDRDGLMSTTTIGHLGPVRREDHLIVAEMKFNNPDHEDVEWDYQVYVDRVKMINGRIESARIRDIRIKRVPLIKL